MSIASSPTARVSLGAIAPMARDGVLFVYLVYTLAQGLPRLLGAPAIISAEGSILNQTLSVLLFAVGASLLLAQGALASRSLRVARIYVIPIAIIVASILWSNYPDLSTRRVFRFVIEVAGLIMIVASFNDPQRLLRLLTAAATTVLVLDLALLLAPSLSMSPNGYQGVHDHKNQLGQFIFVSTPLYVLMLLRRSIVAKLFAVVVLAAAVGLLIYSQSKTALGVIPISLAVAGLIWLRSHARPLARGVMLLASLVFAGGLAIVASFASGPWTDALSLIGLDPTLTGRDRIWTYALWRWSSAPWTGVGYGALWEVNDASSQWTREFRVYFDLTEAHNGYIDVLTQTGIIGLVALIIMLLMLLVGLMFQSRPGRASDISFFANFLFFGALIYNITESSFLRAGHAQWIWFVILTTSALVQNPQQSLGRRERRGA